MSENESTLQNPDPASDLAAPPHGLSPFDGVLPPESESGRRDAYLGFLIGVTVAVGLQLLVFTLGTTPASTGEFLGPDSYMRLSRVLECRGGFGCPDGLFPRANAPYGDILHWPWLVDRILLALAGPLVPVIGFRSAVAVAGHLFGPLMEVAAIGFLIVGARALVKRGLPFVGLLMASQLWVLFAFLSARPDHHGFQAALFAGVLAFSIRSVLAPERALWPYLAGLFGGIAIWASTEALISLAPLFAVLASLWLVFGDQASAILNRRMSAAIAGTLLLGLFLDGPLPNRWSPDFDRFSVVHVTLFTLLVILWHGLGRLRISRAGTRLVVLGLAGSVVGGVMIGLYPGVQRGPTASLPPELWSLWLNHTAEYVPLVHMSNPALLTMFVVPLLLALPTAVFLTFLGTREHRPAWAFVMTGLVWFAILTAMVQVRWTYYLQILLPIPLAWILGNILERSRRISTPLAGPALVVLSVAVFAFGPTLGAAIAFDGDTPIGGSEADCTARGIMPVLSSIGQTSGPHDVILAPIFWGPEIVYRTNLDVVATPYHRNTSGILGSYRIMEASPDRAWDLIRERQIRWITICAGGEWLPLVRSDEEGTFYEALQRGVALPWLAPVQLPDSIGGTYALWEVDLDFEPNGAAIARR